MIMENIPCMSQITNCFEFPLDHNVLQKFDDSGQPTRMELHRITRKADGSPMEEQVAVVPWPA